MSFSKQVKDEYCALPWEDLCCIQTTVLAALLASAKIKPQGITLSTSHCEFAQRISAMIAEMYDADVKIAWGRELCTITIARAKDCDEILSDLAEKTGYDPIRGTMNRSILLTDCCRKAFLRGFYLAAGSLNEPIKSYHMEFSIRRASVAQAAIHVLKEEGISASVFRRGHYVIVAINEAQLISDFLLITGAHAAMLEFESLRVDKSIRNTVNRVVNCDNANTTRIAFTGARQTAAVEYIRDRMGLDVLAADLEQTAILRLENPDLSLKELSELSNPTISKSGIHHRLKKIERIALEHKMKGSSGTMEDQK